MSILQSPSAVVEQIDWYLRNEQHEQFPGAFVLAAGNLSRQLLEQILFILCFYGRVPRRRYLRSNTELCTSGTMLKALSKVNPESQRTYMEGARRRGLRIRKFARHPRSLNRWRRLFNEASHFRNPGSRPKGYKADVQSFAQRIQALLDPLDDYLITAAINEIRSKGKIKAVLSDDSVNTPGVQVDLKVTAKNLYMENGILALRTPTIPIQIIPDKHEIPTKWSDSVIVVQHTAGMKLCGRIISEAGVPIDLRTMETVLTSLSSTDREMRQLRRRLRALGFDVEVDAA